LFFPTNGVIYILMVLEPYEAIALVGCCEAGDTAFSMFLRSTLNAISHSAVQNVASAGDDIDVVVMVLLAHRWLYLRLECEPQVPPLRFASVGMTNR
jgi:hypothetical protein